MRKFYLAIASCVALVAFMGFSASALAVVDPSCDGDPYDNTFAVHDFTISTPDSIVQHESSGVSGAGLACGTDISGSVAFGEGGVASLNDRAVIANPPGVTVNAAPSTDIPDGSYVGSSVINIAAYACGLFGSACIKEDEPITLRADNPSAETDCPADALACYNGINDNGLGNAWIWVEEDADGRTTLTIGSFHPVVGEHAGLTDIKSFDLCAYAGAVGIGPGSCGDGSNPDAFVQKNGDARYPDYHRGDGIYTVTVTNKGDATADPPIEPQTTDPVEAYVRWLPLCRPDDGDPRSTGSPGGAPREEGVIPPWRKLLDVRDLPGTLNNKSELLPRPRKPIATHQDAYVCAPR